MDIRTFYFLLFSLFYSMLNVQAQEDKAKKDHASNHYLEIGLGINFHALRDQGTSPLIYEGYIPGIHLQYFMTSKKFLTKIDENFFIGFLRTRNRIDNNKATTYNNDLSFTTLYNFRNFRKSTLYLGGELGTLVNVRMNEKFNNANLNYEFMASLAPSALYEYRTSWKAGRMNLGLFTLKKRDRNIKLQYLLSVPVVTTMLRPGYAIITDFVDNNSLTIETSEIKVASFNHLFILKNQFNFYYVLHNNNMLKFNYNFSYYNYYDVFNPVKGFNSSFFASIVFRFSNN